MASKCKIALLGYGAVGRFFANQILSNPIYGDKFEIAFIWNRSFEVFSEEPEDIRQLAIDAESVLAATKNFIQKKLGGIDLFVEVAHPEIIKTHGTALLRIANLYVASVTAFADERTLTNCLHEAKSNNHTIFLPSGAAWGVHDVLKMNEAGSLTKLEISMQFHADALRLVGPTSLLLDSYIQNASDQKPLLIAQGSIEEIAKIAPNNVNTMTCLRVAASSLSDEKVHGILMAQKTTDAHLIDIKVQGMNGFFVHTHRHNPAKKSAVTGEETFRSFLQSLILATETTDRSVVFI